MKKRIIPIVIASAMLLAFPISIVSIGFGLPSQFGETYYGELSVMYQRLKDSKRKKIVFLGNSAVAFGVRSDLIQENLPDYDVINFGLYGAIGTKRMLDWSRPYIKDGDIVVILPEPYDQTATLYFSSEDVWRAADSDMSLLSSLSWDETKAMIGSFLGYTSNKFLASQGKKSLTEDGPYSKGAFENEAGENAGYMTYERPYNIMAGGYDQANLPSLTPDIFGEGFLDYLNTYSSDIKKNGAKAYFGFCPINLLSLGQWSEAKTDEYYDCLSTELDFPLLGHPSKYFLDYRYFYDNNVHMNSSGAYIFSDLLTEDLKMELGIFTPNTIPLPVPPEIPEDHYEDGDNIDEDKFLYEKKESATGEYMQVVGLSEEGKSATTLTLPASHEGLSVREFTPSTFAGNTVISRITLPSNIRTIQDDSFAGCTRLSELYFRHETILGISVGLNFLRGADNCYIYLRKDVQVADCAGGWALYQSRMRFY